ncbi:MAG TPA: flagellar basal body rod protein FlgB [Hyphomicrobiaceae bacterium]
MQPVNLFDLAAQQARWLSVRQAAVAGNIANVNTPGYRTVVVEPFDEVLDNRRVSLRATHPDHLTTGATGNAFDLRRAEPDTALLPSENSVVLEEELVKQSEIRRAFELNTAIVKAFHSMLMMVTRS